MSRSAAHNSDVRIIRETSIPVLPRITVTAVTMILAMMGSSIVWTGQTRRAPQDQEAPAMI